MRGINTFLVFKDPKAETKELVIATAEEWNQILEQNRSLPRTERRFFMENVIREANYVDKMYIEVTRDEYDKWHSQTVSQYEKDRYGRDCEIISLDQASSYDAERTVGETIADDFDLEGSTVDEILMAELRTALQSWNAWAAELFDYWRTGQYRTCTKELMKKYGISYEVVARRKRRFADFVKNFLQ
jgi:hypothetical protein